MTGASGLQGIQGIQGVTGASGTSYTFSGVSGIGIQQSGNQITINNSIDIGFTQGYDFGFQKVVASVSSSSSALSNISGLSFSVVSGGYYGFEAFLGYYTSHPGCGLALSVLGPTGANSTGVWSSEIMILNTQGTDSYQSQNRNGIILNNIHTTSSVNSSGASSIPLTARLQGYWIPNNSGTVQLQFAPSIATNTGTILKGSWIKWF